MFAIPHLVSAVRRVLKNSASVPPAATVPPGGKLHATRPVLRVVPASAPEQVQSDVDRGPRKAGDCVDEVMRELRLRRDHPLVRVDEEPSASNGYAIGFVFSDREHGGFEYDFYCRTPLAALEWVRQTAGKTWVTTEHLELFADLAISRFTKSDKAA